VAGNLLNSVTKGDYTKTIRAEYDTLREGYLNRSRDKNFLTIEQARANISELKDVKEPSFKIQLDKWLAKEDLQLAPVFREKAKAFIAADYRYFMDDRFLDNELGDYSYLLRELWSAAALAEFTKFRKMLELQHEIISKEAA
ncbi:MAG: hypothetical protein EOO02_11590, partial [Chitinophagaceae bacterium]